jgi:hypothetical protein
MSSDVVRALPSLGASTKRYETLGVGRAADQLLQYPVQRCLNRILDRILDRILERRDVRSGAPGDGG